VQAKVERGRHSVGQQQPDFEIRRTASDAREEFGQLAPFHRLGDVLDRKGIRGADPSGGAVPDRGAIFQLTPLREQDALHRAQGECLHQAWLTLGTDLDAA